MSDSCLTVPARFRGPSSSGNGGWTSGALAAFLPGAAAVSVRLWAPPPLATPMDVVVVGPGSVEARVDGRLVLRATQAPDDLTALAAVPVAAAREAESRYGGLAAHPFPECFSCGTGRRPGDGLVLRPGHLDSTVVATTWVPNAEQAGADGLTIPPPIVWAALDCPGGWSVDIVGRPMVLGTMTAALGRRPPQVGETCVIAGRCDGTEGRKAWTTSTLRGEDGEVLGRARAVWIAVDPASVRPAASPADFPE